MTSDCIINHWLLDISSASLIHQQTGEQRRLGEYQLKLLVVLIQHAGQILSREALNQLVWERRVIGNNSLPNAIHALRVALEDDGKQQRIIKTVPKKGYILEAEYCQFQRRVSEEDETDAQLLSFTPPLPEGPRLENADEIEAVDTLPPSHASPSLAAGPEMPEKSLQFWRKMFWLSLLAFLAVLVLVLRSAFQERPGFVQVPLEGVNQIRLLQLRHTLRDPGTSQQDLPRQLDETLAEIDTELQARAMNMDVYYSASGTSLNLTLNVQSACESQQLAMAIFNANNNPDALSKLVKTETERKLNEMAPCQP